MCGVQGLVQMVSKLCYGHLLEHSFKYEPSFIYYNHVQGFCTGYVCWYSSGNGHDFRYNLQYYQQWLHL